LFELEVTDYQGWAKGLKQAGYATSPTYAESLIKLIEKYNLNEYDSGKAKPVEDDKPTKRPNRNNSPINDNFSINPYLYEVQTNNTVPYIVIADTSISLSNLSVQLDLMNWQLAKYNDLDKNSVVVKGEQIYIKPKRNKADKQHETHKIARGETMRDVSQRYAVKLKKIYKYNNIQEGTEPEPGTVLNLRKKKK